LVTVILPEDVIGPPETLTPVPAVIPILVTVPVLVVYPAGLLAGYAPRLDSAVAASVAPVPPLTTARVPLRVKVPEAVIGPPVNVSPVVPPLAFTDVTVPAPATASQIRLDPFHFKKVSVTVGADTNPVVLVAV
jgi:hypothetical protein